RSGGEIEGIAERAEIAVVAHLESAEPAAAAVALDDDDELGHAIIVRVARDDSADGPAGNEGRVERRPYERRRLDEKRHAIGVDGGDLDARDLSAEIGRNDPERLHAARVEDLVVPPRLAFEEPRDRSRLRLEPQRERRETDIARCADPRAERHRHPLAGNEGVVGLEPP